MQISQKAKVCVASNETRRSEVTRALDELGDAVNQIRDAISDLYSRLRPVMQEEPPGSSNPSENVPMPLQLWCRVDCETSRITEARQALVEIMARLEL